MEKFGIFDLLDTLSAITQQEETAAKPSSEDAVFTPPAYPTEEKEGTARDALGSFLSRHDAIARKIDKSGK